MKYYIIDTETTGLKAGWNEITEISIIRCDDREQLTERIAVKYPERASAIALEITGKTVEDILEGESKLFVVDYINKWLEKDGLTPEHRCFIAHNANFDKRFCHSLWDSVGLKFPAVCWLDTIKFAKGWAAQVGNPPDSYKLQSVLKFANITPLPGVHNAKSDSQNTYLFWKKGMDLNIINHLSMIKRWKHE